MSNLLQPTQQTERIRSLDVLRGFALLGILFVNIQAFGLVSSAYQNPTAFGDFTGVNYWAWWTTFFFFDSKMMAIFSMLFGAGIVLMSERSIRTTGKVVGLHYRRMFWLLLFGLAHAYLLWYGDILVSYAICGMVVFWLRKLGPKWLIAISIIFLAVSSGIFLLSGLTLPMLPEEELAKFQEEWNPSGEKLQAEIDTYRGGWLEQAIFRAPLVLVFQTFLFGIFTFWRASGLMLLGMALFKLRILNAERSKRFYVIGAAIGFLIGYSLVLTGIASNEASNWETIHLMFIGSQYNYWGSIFVSFGYICVVMLFCKSEFGTMIKTSLQSVGQMALTNYLIQTIICTTIFYGYGLGWFCYLSRIQLLGVVVAIWIAQLIVSPIWLSRFRYGPFEWVWRSLAYWKPQPMSLQSGR